MRQGPDGVVDPMLRSVFDDACRQDDQALASLETELLVTRVVLPLEVLETFRRREPGEYVERVANGRFQGAGPCFHLPIEPLPLCRRADMRGLEGNRAAVD